MPKSSSTLANNKKARFDLHIVDTIEAGIVLVGCEVKSIRQGNVNLKESFARIQQNELWLIGCHVSPYEQGNRMNPDPVRDRKLLLHRQEIKKLTDRMAQKSLILVPLSIYLSRNRVKVQLGLGQPKKHHDKRDSLKKKAQERDINRQYKIS